MHESTSGSSSEGKQLKKRVTFGEPIVVGSPHSGEGDGTVDSGQKESGGGQNVVINGATENTGGTGLISPDSGESSSGQQSDHGGESPS